MDNYNLTQTGAQVQADLNKIESMPLASAIATKSELTTGLAAKQNTISDLDTIRAGADLGGTSIQPGDNVSDLTNDAGYLTEHQSLSAYRTASAQDAIDATLATKNELSIGLSSKQNVITDLATIRSGAALGTTAVQPETGKGLFSGSYNDLTDKPTIPGGQVNSNWNATSGVAQILNKPNLATVATSGSYNDLSNKPTIPTVPTKVSAFTNDSGYITSSYHDSSKLDATKCTFQTTAPTAAISDNGVHIVYLTSEPSTKYNGYIYLIKE